MKTITLTFIAVVLLSSCGNVFAQNNRLNTNNTIGWYNCFGSLKLYDNIGIHAEYQWRRNNLITDWQQSLFRVGINYSLNQRVLFRAGYAWIETFPYGEYSINGFGKDFTEHRVFEMIQLSHKEAFIDFTHRFMLEQRFIGSYSSAKESTEDKYPLANRLRYMIRLQVSLKNCVIKKNIPYVAVYDEVFIGFGKNVNANIFDQNRIGILLGYPINKNIKIEGGYLNQTLQFGRQINGKNLFQNNNGLILNAHFNIDLTKLIND